MEWDGKFYFEWPAWMGTVYAVDPIAIGFMSVVVLPDGVELQLIKDIDGFVEVLPASTRNLAKNYEAERIFNSRGEANPTFAGDWEPLIKLINAAAAVNNLFGVKLDSKEFERLSANGEAEFEVLKQKLSPRAASLINLVDFDGDLSLELYRTGMCP